MLDMQMLNTFDFRSWRTYTYILKHSNIVKICQLCKSFSKHVTVVRLPIYLVWDAQMESCLRIREWPLSRHSYISRTHPTSHNKVIGACSVTCYIYIGARNNTFEHLCGKHLNWRCCGDLVVVMRHNLHSSSCLQPASSNPVHPATTWPKNLICRIFFARYFRERNLPLPTLASPPEPLKTKTKTTHLHHLAIRPHR